MKVGFLSFFDKNKKKIVVVCTLWVLNFPLLAFGESKFHVCVYGPRAKTFLEYAAGHYDIIITGNSLAGKIKLINPKATVLYYRSILDMHTYYNDWKEVNLHEDWFLHDLEGSRCVREGTRYLMDVGSEGWRNYCANHVKKKINEQKVDGVFADNTWINLRVNLWTRSSDGKAARIPPEKVASFRQDMVGMLSIVKEAIGDKLLLYNEIQNGKADDIYLEVADGGMMEHFVHPPWWPGSRNISERQWKQQVDRLINVTEKQGKIFLAQTGSLSKETSDEQAKQIRMFCFTSYLLGKNMNSTFHFQPAETYTFVVYYPEWDIEIGEPLGHYYKKDGVYQRDFSNGKVLVNPKDDNDSSIIVPLDTVYRTLEGEEIIEVGLRAKSGIILLN